MNVALEALAVQFDRWREGRISCADLHDAIHEYHDGIGREIWKRFSTRQPEVPLAHAVAAGLIARESLPAELLELVEPLVQFFRQQEQDE